MKKAIIIYIFLLLVISAGFLFVITLKNTAYDKPYSFEISPEGVVVSELGTMALAGFQSEYAVIEKGTELKAEAFADDYAALLVDNTDRNFITAHNVYDRIYPASTTKLVTFMVVCDAIDQGVISLDDEITFTRTITFSEYNGATRSPLYTGCTVSVRNLLFAFMIRSYNDYGVVLGEAVAGSEAAFVDMMNEKLRSIGATGSHMCNPHGLHEDDHYVTAYDLYLIINEVDKYPLIHEIDTYDTYIYTYSDPNGLAATDEVQATNMFVTGEASLPGNVDIVCWKTGTTSQAGYCLDMIFESNGKKYTVFVADPKSKDALYSDVSSLFNYVN